MRYTVVIQEKQEYLRVEVIGERKKGQEANDAKEFWLHIANVCNHKGVSRLLVIFNLSGSLSETAGYEMGKWFAENAPLKNIKTAVVDLNDESRKANMFVETVASNRTSRYDLGQVFGDEEKAVAWLLKQRK